MPKHIEYTLEQIEFIRCNYRGDHISLEYCAKMLGLKPRRISYLISLHGLGLKKQRSNKVWDDKLKDKLVKLAENHTQIEAASILNVALSQIQYWSFCLQIHWVKNREWYSLKDVCSIINRNHNIVRKFMQSGILRAEMHVNNTSRIAIHRISRENLKDFLLRYPSEISPRCDILQILDIVTDGGLRYGKRRNGN